MGTVLTAVDHLLSVIYVSSACQALNEEEILSILRTARTNNERLNITGMLLYRDGNFLQVLEGPAGAVDEILGKIRKDSRHRGLILMSRKTIEDRQFGEWRMAFRNMSKDHPTEAGLSRFLDSDFCDEEFTEESQLAIRLLNRFKQDNR